MPPKTGTKSPSKAKKSKTGTKSPSKAISIGLPPKTSRIAREDHASKTFSAQNIAFVSDNLPLSGRSLNRIAVDKFIHGASRPQTRSVSTQMGYTRSTKTQTELQSPRAMIHSPERPSSSHASGLRTPSRDTPKKVYDPETKRNIKVGGAPYWDRVDRGVIQSVIPDTRRK